MFNKEKKVCTGVHISFFTAIFDNIIKKYGLLRNPGNTTKSELTNKPQCYIDRTVLFVIVL